MKSTASIKQSYALIPALLLTFLVGSANQTFAGWEYGNGRHGTFVLTTNATIEQLYQTVRLTNDPAQYDPANSNAIPNFQNLTITNGATLTANAWDGVSGGILSLKVQATLAVASSSSITVTGIGYRGGNAGQQGESYLGVGGVSYNANSGGGGGGKFVSTGHGSFYYGSAGGGGYGAGGGAGYYRTSGGNLDSAGYGGNVYGDAEISTLNFGSGGGGGVSSFGGPNGGNGGGVIALNVGQIQLNGLVQANGNNGGDGYGAGGGGSGGSLYLRINSGNIGTNIVSATGGSGGASGNIGGNGGDGRIRIDLADFFTGVTTPPAYTLRDTNSGNVTIITTQPTSQTSAWSSNAVFSVGFTAITPLSLQWYFNSSKISNATNRTLILTNLVLTNQGNYFVTISNAVMSTISSNAFLTVLDIRDFDGDGIPNYWETQFGLNPNNPADATNHPPGDALTYLQKYLYGLSSTNTDTDGDGISDYNEIFLYHSNPLSTNTSGDAIPDGWKVQYGLNPSVANANDEISSSGVSYWQVYQYNFTHTNQLDPRQPFFAIGSGIYEVLNGGQRTNRMYYDRNDRLIGAEYSRGVSIAYKNDGNGNIVRQTVFSRANETNGLPVLWQFLNGLTNNVSPYTDSDGDGWTDYQEWKSSSNPRDTNSTPNLLGNPGTNIASLVLPFTPSNFVVGVGQLDGAGAEEIVIGADGNPGTNVNWLQVLTQTATGWSTQRVDVGSFGITSIAVGQITNRLSPAIYVGLRQIGGVGRIVEFSRTNTSWFSNVVTASTNESAFVLGIVSGNRLFASVPTTNSADGATVSFSYANGNWSFGLVNTNTSHLGLGTVFRGDSANISTNLTVPTTAISNNTFGKLYFPTPNRMTWSNAQAYAQQYGGNLATVTNSALNTWLSSQFQSLDSANPGTFWIGLYRTNCSAAWTWISGAPYSFSQWGATQPDCSGGLEKVVQMYGGGLWNDLNNDNSFLFGVVEVPIAPPSTPTIATDFGLRLLDMGGIQVFESSVFHTNAIQNPSNGKSYYQTPNTMTWLNAQAYAQQEGGNLATINTSAENAWLRSHFTGDFWIGLFRGDCSSAWKWVSGASFSYANWGPSEPNCSGGNENFGQMRNDEYWNDAQNSFLIPGVVEVSGNFFQIFIGLTNSNNRLSWRGLNLDAGLGRQTFTRGYSIYNSYIEDSNASGQADAGDVFVTSEFFIYGTNVTVLTSNRQAISAINISRSYGLASINYLNSSNEVFFTGEPDGQVFAWLASGATNALQKQIFSAQHLGKAWHALAGVKTLEPGEGLIGLRVDSANQNSCTVILWSPQPYLPELATISETAPLAAAIPSTNSLGGNAVVTIRLWDAEGNSATPFLQYQLYGSTNWRNATLTLLDGGAYSSSIQVAAAPGGSNHTLGWNALVDVGVNVITNIQLRTRAQDFMLLGDWSLPTPFQLDTTIVTNPNPTNPPVNFTGITTVPGGIQFNWQGGTNAWLYLQRSPALAGTNAVWVNIWTGAPPTPIFGSYTDYFGTNLMRFYRLKIGSP